MPSRLDSENSLPLKTKHAYRVALAERELVKEPGVKVLNNAEKLLVEEFKRLKLV